MDKDELKAHQARCLFREYTQTSTREVWWFWFRNAARYHQCRGAACAWCPRTRHGMKARMKRASQER